MASTGASDTGGILCRLPLIVVAVAAVIGFVLLRPYLSFEALARNREALLALRDANHAATVLAFLLAYTAIVALSLPGATVATLTGGFLFSTFPGVFYNVAAATSGAVLLFFAARMGLGERLAARMQASHGAMHEIKEAIDANQWSVLFLIRLVPAVPFFLANLLPALVGVPVHRFVITTALGILPGGLVFTSVGAGLGEVFARGELPDPGIVFEPRILLPILGLCALALLPVLAKAWRRQKVQA